MLKILKTNTDIQIPLEINGYNNPFRNDVEIKDNYVADQIVKSIPVAIDYEKKRFSPLNINQIIIKLYKSSGEQYVLEDFNFSNDDVKFFTKKLKKTHLKLRYFTKPSKINSDFLFSRDIYIQRQNFYDSENKLKDVSEIPLVFYLQNPKIYPNYNEGYFYYLVENQVMYLNFRLNSGLDGVSYVFYNRILNSVNEIKEEFEFIKLSPSNPEQYTFNTLQDTNITQNNDVVTIKLYNIE